MYKSLLINVYANRFYIVSSFTLSSIARTACLYNIYFSFKNIVYEKNVRYYCTHTRVCAYALLAIALPSNIPTPSSRLRRVKCSAMNGDDLVGKQRSRYGSPSRTSGLCDTFTFSPLTSSHSLVKSHRRSELSSEPMGRMALVHCYFNIYFYRV